MSDNNTTIDESIRDATRILAREKIENAALLARHILCEATGLSPEQLILCADESIDDRAARKYREYLVRACKHEPLSRITGSREFYGRTFKLNEATLDPRPDSETLIEAVLELASEQDETGWYHKPFRFLDIGTGTGCLAITLLAELPNASALASDISKTALEAARTNASDHRVLHRLQLQQHSCLEGVTGPFELLISNPPYIPSNEIGSLAPEVKNFDPQCALDGGSDGLKFYRQIASGLERVVPQGWVVFEVGAGQFDDVLNILKQLPISEHRTWKDLSGHTRCVAIKTHYS